MSLLRNTSWSAVATVASTGGRMVIAVVLARRLGPASFGVFVFVQWLIDITALVCSAGLPGVATRFFPQTAGKGPVTLPGFSRWFLRWGVTAVLLTSVLATACAVAFAGLAKAAPIAAVAFWATTSSAWALLGARAQGLFEFKRYAASSAVFVAVALLALALPPVGGEFVGAMVGFGAANLAAAACCAVRPRHAVPTQGSDSLTKQDVRLIRSYATNAWLTSVAGSLVWSRGEIPLIKGNLGESAVGIYSVGLTLAGVVNQGLALLTGGLWPQIAGGWDSGERDRVLRLSSLVTNLLILAAGVSSGFVICWAPYLIAVLFGEQFHESSDLVAILALGALGLGSGSASLVLQAATNGKFGRNVTFAGCAALFGAALVLVPHYGIAGAAVARSATQIAVAVTTFVWLGKVTGHSPGSRENLRSFLLHVALGLALVTLLTLQPNLQVVSRLVLFAVYSSIVCLLCAPIRDRSTFRELRTVVGVAHG